MTHALVVDDKEENTLYLEALMKSSGWTVDVAYHGAQALELARVRPPDIVIADLLMPVMDGYEVARGLRCIAGLARVPIIAVTSYAMVGDREKALASGCNGYIEKPIDPDTFVAEIERIRRSVVEGVAP